MNHRKIITAIAAGLTLIGTTGCDPTEAQRVAERIIAAEPEPSRAVPQAPQAHQQVGSVYLDVEPTCAHYFARITNGNTRGSILVTAFADGQQAEYEYIPAGTTHEIDLYFPNNSGDHTVSLRWPGGTDTQTIWTNCGP